MSSSIPQALQRAAAYLQAGKPQLARPLLIEIVRQQPDSEEGWLLLSHAVAEQQQKIDCLQRVLRIDPGNMEAQTRLRQLLSPPEERAAPIVIPPPVAPPTRPTEVAPPKPSDLEALRVAAVAPPIVKRRSKARFKKSQWIAIGATAFGVIALIGIALALLLSLGASPADRSSAPAVAIAASATPTLTTPPFATHTKFPSTWTPTPTLAPTSTRTATPFPTLNPTLLGEHGQDRRAGCGFAWLVDRR